MSVEEWEIDVAHSSVHFWVRHMVISKVHGRFREWSGTIRMDEGNLADSEVEVRVDASTIDTQEPDRDAHLKSADFLDVEHYPELLFKSTRVEIADPNHFQVFGNLEIHGTSREVVLDCVLGGRAVDPWGNDRIGLEARTRINRKDFGMEWNQLLETGGLLVGDEVEVTIEAEAIKKPATAAA